MVKLIEVKFCFLSPASVAFPEHRERMRKMKKHKMKKATQKRVTTGTLLKVARGNGVGNRKKEVKSLGYSYVFSAI